MDFHDICEKVYSGQYLNYDEAKFAFDTILTGEINDIVISSFLTALRVRGHQLDEIYGAASALLDAARPFPTPYYDFCDIVGTGGDGFKTINISTISAFVAATLGLKVAKHGNRAASSMSGTLRRPAASSTASSMTTGRCASASIPPPTRCASRRCPPGRRPPSTGAWAVSRWTWR